jgi:hypothetical protein
MMVICPWYLGDAGTWLYHSNLRLLKVRDELKFGRALNQNWELVGNGRSPEFILRVHASKTANQMRQSRATQRLGAQVAAGGQI